MVGRLLYHLIRLRLLLRAAVLRRVFGIDGVSKLLYACPQPFVALLLRRYGASIAHDAVLDSPLIIHNAAGNYRHLTIGHGCHVGRSVFLDLTQPVVVGPRATVSMGSMVLTHFDVGRSPLRDGRFPRQEGRVVIGAGAYIGAGAILLHGVRIGEEAVVAAAALVRDDVPPHEIYGGIPARPLGKTSLPSEQTR